MTRKIILYSFLFIFSGSVYSQSPWVNKQGSLYGQISATYLSYGSVIDEELNKIVPTDFNTRDITTSLYADYSLTDNLAVLFGLPYKSVQHNGESLSSLGDPTLKLKYQISKKSPFSGYLGYTAPLSQREGLLRTGYNQHSVEGGVSIGKGREKYFIYGGIGYRYRTNIPNQVLVEFEYGYRFLITKKKKPLYLIFHIDGMLKTSSVLDPEAGQAKLYHNNGEFLSPAIKLSYNVFDSFWINTAIHSAVIVRNFGAASTLNFGIAYKIVK